MLRSFLVLTAATAVLVAAPAAPVPKAKPTGPLYFPTKVGTKWVYEQDGCEVIRVVTKVEAAERGTLVTVRSVVESGQTRPFHTVLVSEAGVSLTEEAGQPYDSPLQVLKLHQTGGKWETTSSRNVRNGVMTLHGTNSVRGVEEVRVPAGRFKAVRVDSCLSMNGQPPWKMTNWFAPGVGVVRDESSPTTLALKSFTLGQD